MPSIETAIWLALKGRVQTLPLSPMPPISFPNESFKKPNGTYLRVTHIPNMNRRILIGSAGPHHRLSLLQIDVFAPLNQNVAVAVEMAGQIAQHFPTDLRITAHGVTARVMQAPTVGQPMLDDTHVMVPVTIQVETFA
jgi:hypothetical protein